MVSPEEFRKELDNTVLKIVNVKQLIAALKAIPTTNAEIILSNYKNEIIINQPRGGVSIKVPTK